MNPSAGPSPVAQHLDDALGYLGCNARSHEPAHLENQQRPFASSTPIERKPVAGGGCSPNAALAGCPAHRPSLDALDFGVGDPLGPSPREVIAANRDSVLIEPKAGIFVQGFSHLHDGATAKLGGQRC